MKREILFRGKRVDNGEWVYGDLFRSNKDHHTPNVCIVTDEFHPLGYGSNTFYQVLPETVGQFTGLLDKNGNRIFEGDVLNIGSESFGFIVDKNDNNVGYEVRHEGCDFVLFRNDINTQWGRLSRLDEIHWTCVVHHNIHDK